MGKLIEKPQVNLITVNIVMQMIFCFRHIMDHFMACCPLFRLIILFSESDFGRFLMTI